jgi:hypothetical protein
MKRATWLAVLAIAVFVWTSAGAAENPAPTPKPPAVPPVVVETALPAAGDHVPQCAFDGKPDTYFQATQARKAGDALTVRLAEPAKVKRVEVLTGKPDGTDALEGAVLEIATDGKTFEQAARFESGAAKADLAGRAVKALRVRATADAAVPLAIREITIDAQPPVPVFKYPIQVRLDCSEVPEMKEWCERARDLVEQWYPVLAEYLASDLYTPARRIGLTFKKGDKGIAGTGGSNITAYSGWFKAHPDDYGAIIHESIHVIQAYPRGTPGWLVEGLDDYVRFWIYEPQTPRRRLNPERIRYQDSYQVTAAFLAWLVETQDKDIVKKLNAASHKGQYSDGLFKEYAGKDLDTLWEEFKKSLATK